MFRHTKTIILSTPIVRSLDDLETACFSRISELITIAVFFIGLGNPDEPETVFVLLASWKKVRGRKGASCSAVTMRINVSVGTKEDNVQRYCIECMPSSSAAPMPPKRFRDFEEFDKALREATGFTDMLPRLPEKHLLGLGLWRDPEQALLERAFALESYLNELLENQMTTPEIKLLAEFLSVEEALLLAPDYLQLAEESIIVPDLDAVAPGRSAAPSPTHYAAPACLSVRGVLSVLRMTLGFALALWYLLLVECVRLTQRLVGHVSARVGARASPYVARAQKLGNAACLQAHAVLEQRHPALCRLLTALASLAAERTSAMLRRASHGEVESEAASGVSSDASVSALRAALVEVLVLYSTCVHRLAARTVGPAAADGLAGMAVVVLAASSRRVFPAFMFEILDDLRVRAEAAAVSAPAGAADPVADRGTPPKPAPLCVPQAAADASAAEVVLPEAVKSSDHVHELGNVSPPTMRNLVEHLVRASSSSQLHVPKTGLKKMPPLRQQHAAPHHARAESDNSSNTSDHSGVACSDWTLPCSVSTTSTRSGSTKSDLSERSTPEATPRQFPA